MKSALAPFLPCVLALGMPWSVGAEAQRAGPQRAPVGNFRAGGSAQRDHEPRKDFATVMARRSPGTLLAAASPATRSTAPPVEATPSAGLKGEERRLLAKMAAEGTNSANLFAIADVCHDEGVEGDSQAVLRAEAYLRQLLGTEPNHSRALALLGSVYTMKGRDAFWPTTQIRLVKEGNTYMDEAVKLAPDDIPTRTIRALNNAHMPEFLGRSQVVREDLDWLWRKIEAGNAPITTSAKQQLALHWGRILRRQRKTDEASKVLRAGRDFSPASAFAAELSTELDKLR